MTPSTVDLISSNKGGVGFLLHDRNAPRSKQIQGIVLRTLAEAAAGAVVVSAMCVTIIIVTRPLIVAAQAGLPEDQKQPPLECSIPFVATFGACIGFCVGGVFGLVTSFRRTATLDNKDAVV